VGHLNGFLFGGAQVDLNFFWIEVFLRWSISQDNLKPVESRGSAIGRIEKIKTQVWTRWR